MYGDPRAEVFGRAAAGLSAGGGTGMDQLGRAAGRGSGQGLVALKVQTAG